MTKAINWIGVCLLFVSVGVFWAQEKKQSDSNPPPASPTATAPAGKSPHTFNITVEEAAKKNPVRFSDFSVEKGKKLFSTQCAMCHGAKGDGKGDPDFLAEIKASPSDLTKADTLKDRTDGALFAIITTGSETMPGQTSRMNERHKWNLVNYLRSLNGKVPEKATEEEKQEGTAIVPPKEDH